VNSIESAIAGSNCAPSLFGSA